MHQSSSLTVKRKSIRSAFDLHKRFNVLTPRGITEGNVSITVPVNVPTGGREQAVAGRRVRGVNKHAG